MHNRHSVSGIQVRCDQIPYRIDSFCKNDHNKTILQLFSLIGQLLPSLKDSMHVGNPSEILDVEICHCVLS